VLGFTIVVTIGLDEPQIRVFHTFATGCSNHTQEHRIVS
jgi:hypothetical protein